MFGVGLAYVMPAPALLVVGRTVSARNFGLFLPRSSEVLFVGLGCRALALSLVSAGEIDARSNVGDGTVRSIAGDSEGVFADVGSIGEKTGRSWDRTFLL